jgi:hypothetical protein
MPEHVLMSEVEIITDGGCRRPRRKTTYRPVVALTPGG